MHDQLELTPVPIMARNDVTSNGVESISKEDPSMQELNTIFSARSKHVCWTCGGTSQKHQKVCSDCRVGRYCCKACQRQHWPQHREVCEKGGKARQRAAKLFIKPEDPATGYFSMAMKRAFPTLAAFNASLAGPGGARPGRTSAVATVSIVPLAHTVLVLTPLRIVLRPEAYYPPLEEEYIYLVVDVVPPGAAKQESARIRALDTEEESDIEVPIEDSKIMVVHVTDIYGG